MKVYIVRNDNTQELHVYGNLKLAFSKYAQIYNKAVNPQEYLYTVDFPVGEYEVITSKRYSWEGSFRNDSEKI